MEGTVTSFRYPHLHVGRQPSYPMPPPATIYGHICSAVGEWIAPDSLQFAYCFTHSGSADDLELIHMAAVGSGRLDKEWGYVRNIEVQTNVLPRQVLLNPKLTLYVDGGSNTEKWAEVFRSPVYPVLLGRSQDLAAYRMIDLVELEQTDFGYFQDTLLPWTMRDRIPQGATFHMPKFIDPKSRDKVTWDKYVILNSRVWWPNKDVKAPKGAKAALRHTEDGTVWIDPESPRWGEGQRIVAWHSWV